MVEVKLEGLTKYFDDVRAVEDLDLIVRDKEFLTLLGPSGCGKTTILRCIAGLERPTRGKIFIGEKLVTDLPPKDRNIAMVFQSYALYPHMTVYDNIAFPLKLRKSPKDEIERRVQETSKLLGIGDLLDRKPKQLSGGQRQRVALGRSIIRHPSVFLLDEPLSNLDAKLRVQMRGELKRLQRRLETTLIYVTHDQVEAMTMSDRIVILNDGLMQQTGSSIEIYDHPKNLFIAGFIGSPSMSLIECSMIERENEAFLDAGEFTVNIPEGLEKIINEKASELVLGVRSEDISMSRESKPSSFKVEIYVLEHVGSKILATLKAGKHLITVDVDASFKGDIGDEVFISFNTEKIHVFDKKTQEAII